MVVEVVLDGQRLLVRPRLRDEPAATRSSMVDGAEDDHRGLALPGAPGPTTAAGRCTGCASGGWELAHTTDELPVQPVDVRDRPPLHEHVPGSHFRTGLMLTKHVDGRHVTVTHTRSPSAAPGEPTEHRDLRDGELAEWLRALEVPLTADEESRLLARFAAG